MPPDLKLLIDATEQKIQSLIRNDMEISLRWQGTYTANVQYAVNSNDMIIHNTRHSPKIKHGIKAYKIKHPTLPEKKSLYGVEINLYGDRGYQDAPDI